MTTTTSQDERAPSAAPVRIPLHNRAGDQIGEALISPEDADLRLHRWHRNAAGYAIRLVTVDERTPKGKRRQRAVFLHREVLGLAFGDPLQGDHINRNRLDNRRENLRVVTAAEQRQNCTAGRGASSHRGVAFRPDKTARPWHAYANLNGKRTNIGFFATEDEAAEAARAWRLANMPAAID